MIILVIPMDRFEDLLLLVSSLNKAEKRYFKLWTSLQQGEKLYLKIFEKIDGQQTEEEIYNTYLPSYTKDTIDTAFKHLYKVLMKSLRSFKAGASVESTLMNLIADIKILFDKGLYRLCFREINKAKKMALQFEKFPFYTIVARLEIQYLTYLNFLELELDDLLKKQNEIQNIIHHELSIHKHSSLYEILSLRYFKTGVTRSEEEIERLNDLLIEEFQIMSNKHYNSFESQLLHLHFQSAYFMMTGNVNQSLKVFHELDDFFQINRALWIHSPEYYIYLLQGILNELKILSDYEEMFFFLNRLESFSSGKISENLITQINYISLKFRLSILINKGKFEEGMLLVKQYGIFPDDTSKIPYQHKQNILLSIGILYFSLSKFKEALIFINIILNQGTSISREIYFLARLVNLLIHFENNNFEFLRYEVRSMERKLKGEKGFYKVEKATIEFLKKWIKTPLEVIHLHEFGQRLKELQEDNFEQKVLTTFNFHDWVNSKIKKVSLKEYIEKHKPVTGI